MTSFSLSNPSTGRTARLASGDPGGGRLRMVDALAGVLLGRRSLPVQIAVATLSVGLAYAARSALGDNMPPGFPFLTFFPAILVTAVFASVRMGLVATVVSLLLAWYAFIPPYGSFAADGPVLLALGFFLAFNLSELFLIWLSRLVLIRLAEERERSAAIATSRDLMFTELQHRVSNNLSTVSALLRMQAARLADSPEARQALLDSTQRLNTVARIQRSLYAPDVQEIAVQPFLRQLSADTGEAYAADAEAELEVDAEDFCIGADQAIPFGLVASEMIMNALEHARTPGETLRVLVRCRCFRLETGGEEIRLEISDNGRGLPEGLDLTQAKSLGVAIALQFAQSLEGSLTLRNRSDGQGALAALVFPRAPSGGRGADG